MHRIEKLLASADSYATRFDAGLAGRLTARPTTSVAIVCCMDARIDLFALLGLSQGDAHVIRNAGGIVTDDVIRSLLISQRMLGTTAIMLIHHTQCGMLSFTDDELKAEIEAETGLRPPFALEAFPDLDADVRQSIARIRTSPYLPHRDIVRGFVYEVETGHLREVELLAHSYAWLWQPAAYHRLVVTTSRPALPLRARYIRNAYLLTARCGFAHSPPSERWYPAAQSVW